MKKSLIVIICLSFILNIQAQNSSIFDPVEVLLIFDKDVSQQEINDLAAEFNAIELGMTPNLKVRKWQIGPFPIITNDGISVPDVISAVGVILGKTKLDGGGVNYKLNPSPVSNYSGAVPTTYDPLLSCGDYPGHIYGDVGNYPVKVGIVDSGIDHLGHNDLFESYFAGGYNFIDENNDLTDDNGHGTRVAGIIAGIFQNSAIPNARIKMYKALSELGTGDLFDCIQALDRCITDNIDIVNLSLGYIPNAGDGNAPILGKVLQELADSGILVVSSAGNDNNNLTQNDYFPASLSDDVDMAVVASTDGSYNVNLSSFSNYGNTNVTFIAPGQDIFCPDTGGDWVYASGTSYAAPFACGVAAQIASTTNNNSKNFLLQELIDRALTNVTADVQVGGIDISANTDNYYQSGGIEDSKATLKSAPTFNFVLDKLVFQYDSNVRSKARLLVVNTLGQTLWIQDVELSKGLNEWGFQLSLPSGFYHFIFQEQNQSFTESFFKH
jgi:subtilisin family serine protease